MELVSSPFRFDQLILFTGMDPPWFMHQAQLLTSSLMMRAVDLPRNRVLLPVSRFSRSEHPLNLQRLLDPPHEPPNDILLSILRASLRLARYHGSDGGSLRRARRVRLDEAAPNALQRRQCGRPLAGGQVEREGARARGCGEWDGEEQRTA